MNQQKKANAVFLKCINEKNAFISVQVINEFIVIGTKKIKNKYQLSFWDSLILQSALKNECKILYSEDLQHNQVIENTLKIINPFL